MNANVAALDKVDKVTPKSRLCDIPIASSLVRKPNLVLIIGSWQIHFAQKQLPELPSVQKAEVLLSVHC